MTARDRTVLMVLGVLALMAAFYFTAMKPKRDEIKTVDTKIGEAQQRLQTANAAVTAGEKAKTTYRADYAAVARLAKAVPADDEVPSLVFQLERAANRAYVDFRTMELSASAAAAVPAATPAAQIAAVGAEEKKGQGKDAKTPPPPAPATQPVATQSAAAGLPPGAIVGAAGFPTMPFDFSFTGRFFRLEDFFEQLDRMTRVKKGGGLSVSGRLLTVDGFSIAAAQQGFPAMTAQIRATSYLLPEAATQGLTPATPAGPGAVSDTTTTSGSTAVTPVATAGVGG